MKYKVEEIKKFIKGRDILEDLIHEYFETLMYMPKKKEHAYYINYIEYNENTFGISTTCQTYFEYSYDVLWENEI